MKTITTVLALSMMAGVAQAGEYLTSDDPMAAAYGIKAEVSAPVAGSAPVIMDEFGVITFSDYSSDNFKEESSH